MTEEQKNSFKNFIQTAMNHEFNAGLKSKVAFANQNHRKEFVLADAHKHVFVHIVYNFESRVRAEVRDEIRNDLSFVANNISRSKPYNFIIVFAVGLSANDRQYFESEFVKPSKNSVHLFDREQAIILGQKHKVNYNDFFHSDDSTLEGLPDLVDDALIRFQALNSHIFVGGHTWTDENLLQTFINQKRWENGKVKGNTQAVNSARVGDVVLMKSTYVEKKISFLRVKAIGVVTENQNDGHNLKVDWIVLGDFVNVPGLGKLRNTFQLLYQKDHGLLFRELIKSNPYLIDQITLLITEVRQNRYGKKPNDDKKSEETKANEGAGGNLNPPKDPFDSDDQNPNGDDDNSGKDRIPFRLDQVTSEDQLGREPVAKAFADLILKDVFKEHLKHSFIVHLQGEWGSGKSSFLQLIEKKLNRHEKKWIVINYNAWENQHIDPPWWTFIDRIYRQAKQAFANKHFKCLSFLNYGWINLWIKENLRRIIKYSGWKNIISFALTVFFIILLFNFGGALFEYLAKVGGPENIETESKGLSLDIFAKLILSIGSLAGAIYSFSKFLTNPFFMRNADEARSFVKRSADPMEKIRNHFGDLIEDISRENREVAIFIDDIDRCKKEYVVALIEGIQTLFKEKRVLYIIAGDKRWITKSFGNTYTEFKNENESVDELGDLFLEKVFQLSLRLPEVTPEVKKEYWRHILDLKPDDLAKKIEAETLQDLPEDIKEMVTTDLNQNKGSLNDPKYLNDLGQRHNLSGDTVSNIVIQLSNEDKEELRHLLLDFHKLIDPNPRKIKRLANNYTMTRSTLQAERRTFQPKKLFRWLALVNQFPKFEEFIWNELSLTNLNDEKKRELIPVDKISDFETLLFNKSGEFGGPITEQEILSIIGRK